MTKRRTSVTGAWLMTLAAACAAPPAEGGMGLPRQIEGETYAGERGEITGTLAVADNGCIELETADGRWFVIWPADARLDVLVRLGDGTVLDEGDPVTAIGAPTPVAPLVADPAGYWANTIGFCAPDAAEVLVLDEVRPAP